MKGSNRSEVNDLNGAIVRAGTKCGIETPVNRALVQVFNEILSDPKAQKMYSRNPELLEKLSGQLERIYSMMML
jgi:plasmid maintenance system killer protein